MTNKIKCSKALDVLVEAGRILHKAGFLREFNTAHVPSGPHGGEFTSGHGGKSSSSSSSSSSAIASIKGGGSAINEKEAKVLDNKLESMHTRQWIQAPPVTYKDGTVHPGGAMQGPKPPTLKDVRTSAAENIVGRMSASEKTAIGNLAGGNPHKGTIKLMEAWGGATSTTERGGGPSKVALSSAYLALHEASRRAFSPDSVIGHIDSTAYAAGVKHYEKHKSAYDAFIKHQHAATQDYLKTNGITHVSVFRGVKERGSPSATTVHLQPASSFSSSRSMAEGFSGGRGSVYAIRVPANRVLALPMTGMAHMLENEVVIAGGKYAAMRSVMR